MKIVAIVLGVLALAGTIILVIAGASAGPQHSTAMGPLAFLLCIVAVAAMIVLGVTFGGRNNPRRAPHSPGHRPPGQTSTASAVEPARDVVAGGAVAGEAVANETDERGATS